MNSASMPPAARNSECGDEIALADRLVIDRLESQPRRPGGVAQIFSSTPERGAGSMTWPSIVDIVAPSAASRDRPRYRRSRVRRGCSVGMRVPGLIACGLAIQAARVPALFGAAPAAIVWRLMRCVRSGPTVPPASVPRTVWHAPQWNSKSCSPCVIASGAWAAGASCAASHFEKSSGRVRDDVEGHVRVLKHRNIRRTGPDSGRGRMASIHVVLTWPGIASVLPASAGTQNEWITSAPMS